MTGKRSQRKGRGGEKELSEVLNAYGYSTSPGGALNFGKEPDVSGLPNIHIECKRSERLNLTDAMRQAVTDAKRFGDGVPTVFHRKNRQPWYVTMRLQDWIELYEKGCNHDKRPAVCETADHIE